MQAKVETKFRKRIQKRRRIRAKISGTQKRPRLNVHISNQNIRVQLIDDESAQTLASASSVNQTSLKGKTMTEKAVFLGGEIAAKAKKLKIDQVVFDRGRHIYHGRTRALSEAAKKAGLKF